MEAIAELSLS